ncbi:MAG: pyrroline-5-carboxylate reductase [Erysipelotrichales bacterium]|nr:pyrroline-5-carboxylate reductase [Erysipelotrichales bacterium]
MKKLGFIGMGNMASAIVRGIVNSHFIKGEDILAYDIQKSQLDKMNDLDICIAKSANDVIEKSEIVFIAVKPQVLEGVIVPLRNKLKDKALISIVLGYDFDKYEMLLDSSTRHIFVMPNTPVQVLEGMSLLEEKHSLLPDELQFTKDLFSSIGKIEMIPSHLMGVAGSLSGCGPAFIYMIIEGLADGAVKEGLPRNLAYKLASQMVLGSGKMQNETSVHPGILKDNVCSPGGSTIKGVEILEKGRLRSLMMDAITKSTHYK